MRLGFILSVIGHAAVVLVAVIVLASPRLMQAVPTEPVAVDLVPESEIAAPAKEPANQVPPEKAADAGAEARKPDLPRPDAPAQPVERSAAAAGQPAARAQPIQPERQLALAPQPAPPPDPFAPDATPKPLYLPMLTPSGDRFAVDYFDAPADMAARLSREDIAAFQAHLQKCWNPPATVAGAQNLTAVVRIALGRDGAMLAEPILVKASASAQGPALVKSATQALAQCQPFGFLPADKYEEWKVLELSFSPRGLTGGS
jgi:hypothetical protein